MKLIVNGQAEQIESGTTVAGLIARHDLAPLRVAVEVNEELIPRKQFDASELRPGDRVEIVTFVGGG